MRRLASLTILTASLMLAACDGENTVRISTTTTTSDAKGVLRVVETLQCPETIGVLTRKGVAIDGGGSCLYGGPRGAEVSIQLVRLEDQSVDAVLDRFQTLLSAEMPRTTADLRAAAEADKARIAADAAQVQADAAAVEADKAAAAADAAQQASVRAPGVAVDARDDRASVRLPGMSINADGDRASVRFGGFSINADDSSQSVDIATPDETVSVRAQDDAAEIRTRAPGDTVRTTYMLTDSRPSDAGWRMVGYEARGPAGGPIIVATVKAKERDSDGVFDSAKELVTLNVGE